MNQNELFSDRDLSTKHPDYCAEIAEILRGNLSPKLMRERLLDYHENDIATAMELLDANERRRLYSILDADTLAAILEYAEAEKLDRYIGELGPKKQIEILSRFDTQTTVEYLSQLEKGRRALLVELMPAEIREEIALLTSFDEDEIGSRMTTNYVAVRAGISVRHAMRELIAQAAENDNISTIYVIDDEDTFVGAIDLKDLIIAREGTELSAIVTTSYPYVYATEPIEGCIERIKEYFEDSIPVLDADNRLRGVLTASDLAQLIDDKFGDDYAKFAGLTAEEDLKEPLRRSIALRLPWLIVLLGLGILVSGVVGLFEAVVAQLALIVSFQSLVLGMAGNVGTQSLSVTIRILMDEEVSAKQKLYLIGREARIGLTNGAILGLFSFILIGLYLFLLKGQPAVLSFSVSLCVGLALVISMLLSGISGTTVPMLFKKLKIDPAVASGPLITTINDLVAVVTYYGFAWLLLIHVLHF